NVNDPAIYEPLDIILPVINDHMNADAAVRLQYADDYAGLANYWKNQHGEVTSLQNLRVVEKKQQQERELTEWINASSERQKKYGNCLNEIKKAVEGINGDAYKAMTNANLCLSSSATLLTGWRTRNALSLKKGEKGFTPEKIETLMKTYEKNLGNKDKATEIDIIMATLKTWERLPVDKRPDIDGFLAKNFKGSKENFKNALANSIFISKENFEKFVKKPNNKVLEKDPVYQYLQSLLSMIMVNQHVYSDAEKVDLPRRTYLAALKEMNANTPMYPDANSTMRTTYGTVCDYYPADGVHYNYFTTTKGILEKEIPGDPEFDVPAKLKDLILNKDFGQYADKDGTLHVCFLSNNDITGGNSGSPIMNGNGELIGLAFDGNWEALSSDIVFNTDLQRCINVDSRYVLFIIDKIGGQGYLLNEMDIRK
ncbi:MAG: S46 family peptidase, partial [Bacteroidales bacterium]|nr:S46 family peptidase [Bacteroidales bacterium]